MPSSHALNPVIPRAQPPVLPDKLPLVMSEQSELVLLLSDPNVFSSQLPPSILSLVSKPRTAGKPRNHLLTLNLESDSKQRERGTTDDVHTCLCTSLFSPRLIDKTVAINTRLCPYMARHFYSALSDRRSPFVFLQLTNFSSPHHLTINLFVVLVAPFSLTEIRKRPSGLFL